MRGRKPTPTAQRVLAGNPGHRPINDREPSLPPLEPATGETTAPGDRADPPPPATVETPAELAEHALAVTEWQRLAPMLRTARQITDADRSALIACCLEWDRYLTATAHAKKLGMVVKAPSGYPMTNPYLSIATRALSGCHRLWVELGLTPSSRSRVTTSDGPGPGGDAFSEFDEPLPQTH